MKSFKMLLTTILLISLAAATFADSSENLATENAELRKRVDKLEKDVAELKKMISQQVQPQPTKPKPAAPQTEEKLTENDLQKIAQMVQKDMGGKKPITSSLDIDIYGYIKLDAAYDSSRTDVGNFARWVNPETTNDNDDQFNMTANQTRIGAKISGPDDDQIQTSGLVEIDFYGGGAENKPNPMMRHAYLKLLWPHDRFSILAGQTSDVFSPLCPATLNYTVGWWAGNIGYRRPQIRLTKEYTLANDVDMKLEGALARTIGFSSSSFPNTPGDAGEDAGYPGAQARASLTFPGLGPKPTTLGLSGHWAKEELDTSNADNSQHFDSWSVNFDLTQPVNNWLTIKGEVFTGENLSAYLGGIGQGINPVRLEEITSRGGWLAATIDPENQWRFNLGASIDDPHGGDLTGMAGNKRVYNRSIFANAIYNINKNTLVGLELSQWHTEYQDNDEGDSVRAQTSLIYKF